jgi:hypothetical protein
MARIASSSPELTPVGTTCGLSEFGPAVSCANDVADFHFHQNAETGASKGISFPVRCRGYRQSGFGTIVVSSMIPLKPLNSPSVKA